MGIGIILLLIVFASSKITLAHNIAIYKPPLVTVDVGDALRWATENPEANLENFNPRTAVWVVAHNGSAIDLTFDVSLKDYNTDYLKNISCTSSKTIGSGKTDALSCSFTLDLFSGNTKRFAGPELNLSATLEINTYEGTTLVNHYTVPVKIWVIDTNDPAWTLVASEEDMNYWKACNSGETGSFGICFSKTDLSFTQYHVDSSTDCRSAPCVRFGCYGTNGVKTVVKVSTPVNPANYSKCVVVGYSRQLGRFGTYQDSDLICVKNSVIYDRNADTSSNNDLKQFVLPLDSNTFYAATQMSYYGWTYTVLDDLRVFCRS